MISCKICGIEIINTSVQCDCIRTKPKNKIETWQCYACGRIHSELSYDCIYCKDNTKRYNYKGIQPKYLDECLTRFALKIL